MQKFLGALLLLFASTFASAQTASFCFGSHCSADILAACQAKAIEQIGPPNADRMYCSPVLSADGYCSARFTSATSTACGSGGGIGYASTSYTCGTGETLSGGRCVPTGDNQCGSKSGQTFTGQVRSVSGETCPTAISGASGCAVKVQYCATVNGPDGNVYWEIGGSYDGQPSTGAKPVGQAPTGTNTTPNGTTSATGGNAGTGGGGTNYGTAGFNSADASNLARVATNTATTSNAVDRASNAITNQLTQANATLSTIAANTASGGSGTGTGGPSTITGQCGGTGQPACVLDEGNTAATTTGLTNQAGVDAVTAAKDGAIALQDSIKGGGSSLGAGIAQIFVPNFPAASCNFSMDIGTRVDGSVPLPFVLDYCANQSGIHTIITLFLTVLLFLGLQDLFFKTREAV